MTGVTCDACNQYFGQKVEQPALKSFPFTVYRLLSSVPSKKGRLFEMQTTLGVAAAAGVPGRLTLEPRSEPVREVIIEGKSTTVRILAEVTEPLAVCRMLVKMGIEQLASHNYPLAVSMRLEPAKLFCRRPGRGDRWWFVLHANPTNMVTALANSDAHVQVEVEEREGAMFSVARIPGVSTFVPLDANAIPDPALATEDPMFRLVWAEC